GCVAVRADPRTPTAGQHCRGWSGTCQVLRRNDGYPWGFGSSIRSRYVHQTTRPRAAGGSSDRTGGLLLAVRRPGRPERIRFGPVRAAGLGRIAPAGTRGRAGPAATTGRHGSGGTGGGGQPAG